VLFKRVQVVEAFLMANIPLEVLESDRNDASGDVKSIRDLLEEWGRFKLGDVADLRALQLLSRDYRINEISDFFKKQEAVAVIFDGTTKQGELLAVLLRACTEDFTIVQKLVALHTFPAAVDSNQLLAKLREILNEPRGDLAYEKVRAAASDTCLKTCAL
jgi:hypothetical protein